MPPPPPVVVLLEDQAELGRVIREVLGEAGMEVIQVRAAEDAVTTIRERDVAFVVSDLPSLGREHGDPLAPISSTYPDLPIIVIRDKRDDDVPFFGAWREEGSRLLLRRPFRIDDLVSATRELLKSTG
ncbi:MAG: hypothetical protein AMS19_07025 [Gemmatimonas sp. SG8_23]|nr:MAG: hypothetical protein AMS19_07025 [Gemmatimonas sp. SG8_23]